MEREVPSNTLRVPLIFVLIYLATSVLNADDELRLMMMEGGKAFRKVAGCVPHDMGDPGTNHCMASSQY